MCQVTLEGEIVYEEKFEVIGFVPADVVRLKDSVWFEQLDQERIKRVDECLTSTTHWFNKKSDVPYHITT